MKEDQVVGTRCGMIDQLTIAGSEAAAAAAGRFDSKPPIAADPHNDWHVTNDDVGIAEPAASYVPSEESPES